MVVARADSDLTQSLDDGRRGESGKGAQLSPGEVDSTYLELQALVIGLIIGLAKGMIAVEAGAGEMLEA
jgi:hypothetical protein